MMAPHGTCLVWNPRLMAMLIAGNGLIAIAYLSIPCALLVLYRELGRLMPFRSFLLTFSLFIAMCGVTHVMDILTLWFPWYWMQAALSVATAMISLAVAITLLPVARWMIRGYPQ